ncbi:MAG: M28 family peptidase [Promethearchaeota archaeon]
MANEETESEEFEKIEYEDKFDKNRAFKHVEKLAIPRLVGSEGEQKAAKYIKEKIDKLGIKAKEEKFEFTDWVWDVVIRLTEGLKAGLIVITLLMLFLPAPGPLIGVILSVFFLILTFYSSIWARFFWKYQNSEGKIFKVKKYKSKNIIAKVPSQEGADKAGGDIIILAHYDSKSQTFSALWRVVFFYATLIFGIGFSVGYVGYYIAAPLFPAPFATTGKIILLSIAIIVVGAMVLLEINQTGNRSHGAINNATGVGIMMELVEIFAKEPLENMNLTFVATGAGEMGLFGAISFFKAHESEYDKEETFIINLKDIARRGHLYIPGPIGFPPQLPCLEVENLYKKSLKRRKLPIKEGSKTNIGVFSPWVFTGAWNDDMIAVLRGFNANRVGIGGRLRKKRIIHTKKDTIDKVDPDAIDIIGKTTAEVLKRLDLRSRT